jgi:hypothetical protein
MVDFNKKLSDYIASRGNTGSAPGRVHEDWHCPDCGEGHRPKPDFRCNCNQPIAIHIPPGQHVHIKCPVHGDRKLYGSQVTL